ncbi:unnamed protein product [Rhodiola kirilowii]
MGLQRQGKTEGLYENMMSVALLFVGQQPSFVSNTEGELMTKVMQMQQSIGSVKEEVQKKTEA